VALLLLGYSIFSVRLAQYRLLWADEIATFMTASRPEIPLLDMLRSGMDVMPPLYLYLARLSVSVFGATDLAVRIPAMVGGILFSLCFFEILRKWCGSVWAVIGMVCMFQGILVSYVTEARSYALVVGLLALASLAWQRATGPGRTWKIVVMGLAMGAAVAGHYHAVIGLLPIAAGQLARDYRNRRLDFAIWSAMVIPFLVLAAHMPLFLTIRAAYNGVLPGSKDGAVYRFVDTLRRMSESLYLIPAVLLLRWVYGEKAEEPAERSATILEAFCFMGGAAGILFAGKAVSVLTGTQLYPRYLLFSAAGFTGLAVLLVAWRRPPSPAIRMIVLLLVILSAARSMRNEYNSHSINRDAVVWVRDNVSSANGPTLLGNMFSFIVLHHYRTAEKLPLIELPVFSQAESQSAADASNYYFLEVQRRYFPDLPLRNWNELMRQKGQYQVLQWRDTMPWVLRESIRMGGKPQLISHGDDWSVYTVRTPLPTSP